MWYLFHKFYDLTGRNCIFDQWSLRELKFKRIFESLTTHSEHSFLTLILDAQIHGDFGYS